MISFMMRQNDIQLFYCVTYENERFSALLFNNLSWKNQLFILKYSTAYVRCTLYVSRRVDEGNKITFLHIKAFLSDGDMRDYMAHIYLVYKKIQITQARGTYLT